jgi:hypothetical protein
MWQTINNVLTSKNAPSVLCAIIIIILIVTMLTKTGILKIDTKYIKVSASNSERRVIREQCDWARTYIHGLESRLNLFDKGVKYDKYSAKYILECLYTEVVNWITFNSITDTKEYITAKQIKIESLILSFGVKEQFKSKEFIEYVHECVECLIKELINIRRIYNK